jgi:hypothetical protein
MLENNSNRKKITEVVVAVVLPIFTFAILWFWQSGGFTSDEAIDEAIQTDIRSSKVRDALHAVDRIAPLADSVFHSSDFNSLVDFTPQITPVPLGRTDPYSRPDGVVVISEADVNPQKFR